MSVAISVTGRPSGHEQGSPKGQGRAAEERGVPAAARGDPGALPRAWDQIAKASAQRLATEIRTVLASEARQGL